METSKARPFLQRLTQAGPEVRVDLILRSIEEDPEQRLRLSGDDPHVDLEGVDLSAEGLRARRAERTEAVPWWDDRRQAPTFRGADLHGMNLRNANLCGVDLEEADLREAVLAGSDLSGARLEHARLDGADLADVRLDGANLNGADLTGALLENVSMEQAQLRFAVFENAVLEDSSLADCDGWGADFEDAFMGEVNLRRGRLHEADLQKADLTSANLREADLRQSDLRGACLDGADLRDALVTGARFGGASFRRALLQDVDLGGSDIAHVHLEGARMSMTNMSQKQLGGALGEEREENYEGAGAGYSVLENNFEMLGNHDAARWAYVRKRVMQKLSARKAAIAALEEGRLEAAALHGGEHLQAAITEWLCGYGESIVRTLASIVLLFLTFTLFYGLTGSVERIGPPTEVLGFSSLRDLRDLAIFSLVTMTAAEGPNIGLQPTSYTVYLMSGVQVLCTVALSGLLGFVLGNRIRR